jgi:hypothetical protein
MHGHRHRKERWLHTRISEDLEEALKLEARRRRTPVSLLVRDVLESALDLVEDLVEDGLAMARRSRRFADTTQRATATRGEPLNDVYGWQEMILNRDVTCVRCGAELVAGSSAYRGLREQPGAPVFICTGCVRRVQQPKKGPREERA